MGPAAGYLRGQCVSEGRTRRMFFCDREFRHSFADDEWSYLSISVVMAHRARAKLLRSPAGSTRRSTRPELGAPGARSWTATQPIFRSGAALRPPLGFTIACRAAQPAFPATDARKATPKRPNARGETDSVERGSILDPSNESIHRSNRPASRSRALFARALGCDAGLGASEGREGLSQATAAA